MPWRGSDDDPLDFRGYADDAVAEVAELVPKGAITIDLSAETYPCDLDLAAEVTAATAGVTVFLAPAAPGDILTVTTLPDPSVQGRIMLTLIVGDFSSDGPELAWPTVASAVEATALLTVSTFRRYDLIPAEVALFGTDWWCLRTPYSDDDFAAL